MLRIKYKYSVFQLSIKRTSFAYQDKLHLNVYIWVSGCILIIHIYSNVECNNGSPVSAVGLSQSQFTTRLIPDFHKFHILLQSSTGFIHLFVWMHPSSGHNCVYSVSSLIYVVHVNSLLRLVHNKLTYCRTEHPYKTVRYSRVPSINFFWL